MAFHKQINAYRVKQIKLIDQLQYEVINRPFKLNVICAIKFIDINAFALSPCMPPIPSPIPVPRSCAL